MSPPQHPIITLLPGIASRGQDRTTLVAGLAGDLPGDLLDVSGPATFLTENGVCDHPATRLLIAGLPQKTQLLTIPGGEQAKERKTFAEVLERLRGTPSTQLFVAGGGAILNLGTYVAAAAPRISRLVLVPTTSMAIADVALGGLGMLNGEDGTKNALRMQRDPDLIIALFDYLAEAPASVAGEGMIEAAKHALLQQIEAFPAWLALYLSDEPDREQCFEAALATLALKARLMRRLGVVAETEIEHLLSYGHLHAHVIESAWAWQRPHGLCVLIGIMLDLEITGEEKLVEEVSEQVVRSSKLGAVRQMLDKTMVRHYLEHYPATGRAVAGPGHFKIVRLSPEPGAIDKADRLEIAFDTVPLSRIADSYDRVARLIG